MPLNQKNLSKYKPTMVGPVRLITRSSLRARLISGGTYFRAKEWGEQGNLINVAIYEKGITPNKLGICVIHNTGLKPDESISFTGMSSNPNIELYSLKLKWFEEILIKWNGTEWSANIGISRQISFWDISSDTVQFFVKNGLFKNAQVSFRISGIETWPLNAEISIRPRICLHHLKLLSVTELDGTNTSTSLTGWDPEALRQEVNSDKGCWVRMPVRGVVFPEENGIPASPPIPGEDVQDHGTDDTFLTAFNVKYLSGGNGLPSTPAGLNTGPDRVLVHLNYSEKPDGSIGELNQVFEWIGVSAVDGNWSQYS
jgi:hypothetical protein